MRCRGAQPVGPSSASADLQRTRWEAAYLRFETPEQEIRKFVKRFRRLGADRWPRSAAVVELFCGRGSGLCALGRLAFTRLEGVDRSPALLREYSGPAQCYAADCVALPFAGGSRDVVIIQGGLHHLEQVTVDLDRTLQEIRRVLKPDGLIVVVEPWSTPFLRLFHALCRNRIARRLSRRLDAAAIMIEHERPTYDQWLSHPDGIRQLFRAHFETDWQSIRWGKLWFVGHKRDDSTPTSPA
jgi:SAM-dependent methyltransferase